MSKHLRLEHKFVWYYFTLNKINIVIIGFEIFTSGKSCGIKNGLTNNKTQPIKQLFVYYLNRMLDRVLSCNKK
jgi:hypothetical protein